MPIQKEFTVTKVDNQIILEPWAGTSISKAASNAIEFAGQEEQSHEVVLTFNGTKVPVRKTDTIRDVAKRHEETAKREWDAFLASPEGKEHQRQKEESERKYQERQAASTQLLDVLSGKSSFHFPQDMPSITGMGNNFESPLRKQLVIGAQWLKDNPTKTPFAPGHESDRKELEKLMDQTDNLGHSGASFSMLMGTLKAIAEKGFDGYVEFVKEARARKQR